MAGLVGHGRSLAKRARSRTALSRLPSIVSRRTHARLDHAEIGTAGRTEGGAPPVRDRPIGTACRASSGAPEAAPKRSRSGVAAGLALVTNARRAAAKPDRSP